MIRLAFSRRTDYLQNIWGKYFCQIIFHQERLTMNFKTDLYRSSLALLTDLYQITMAYGYWKSGRLNDEAVFNLSFRANPFNGGYTIACGLSHVIDYLDDLKFDGTDIAYLETLRGNDQNPLFEKKFLDYLRNLEFKLDVDAIPEGTAVFAHEPLIRVKGPLLACQLVESPILNLINFQTLIATKSARICQAAQGEPVVEFGLRRAQGIDGSLSASRAAYVGGCTATSNVLAGKLFGIPVKGTHAHSWVMCFDDELSAFEAYARALPNNCIFLVDTYDTLEGVRNAIEAGKSLRQAGHEMVGVRLDSGDLAYLSIEARKMLDEAGFPKVSIVATNDLDEHLISSLKQQNATIAVWGVGTKLVTAYDQPALGGIYKLSAIRKDGGNWQYKVKLSEQSLKTTTPGILQVRRFRDANGYVADMTYDTLLGISTNPTIIDPFDPLRQKELDVSKLDHEDLLVPVFRDGRQVYQQPSLDEIRNRTILQLKNLHQGVRRLVHPHSYPAGLEQRLYDLKVKLILDAKVNKNSAL